MLIVHGVRDVRVRVDQSDRMVAALRRAGKRSSTCGYPTWATASAGGRTVSTVLRKTEKFLRACLGGRASPLDWFEPLAWAWTQWSRFRESAAAPAPRPAGKEQAAQKEDRHETADERR